jgi:hypothetical protein
VFHDKPLTLSGDVLYSTSISPYSILFCTLRHKMESHLGGDATPDDLEMIPEGLTGRSAALNYERSVHIDPSVLSVWRCFD